MAREEHAKNSPHMVTNGQTDTHVHGHGTHANTLKTWRWWDQKLPLMSLDEHRSDLGSAPHLSRADGTAEKLQSHPKTRQNHYVR